MNLNTNLKAENTYDAIVIGSGISGGWAAKELTEKGLKVLLLERGRNIEHIKGYVNANKETWDYPHRGLRTLTQHLPPSDRRAERGQCDTAFASLTAWTVVRSSRHAPRRTRPRAAGGALCGRRAAAERRAG